MTNHEIIHDRHMYLLQLAHKQRMPLDHPIQSVNLQYGLDHSSKPDYPRPNSSKNQHHQLFLAAAEDKTRSDNRGPVVD